MKRSIRYWVKELMTYAALFSVLAVGVDWFRSQDIPRDYVPSLSGTTLTGEWVDVVEQSYHEPVVIYFWATWCPACKFVSPTINWAAKHYAVYGVSGTSPHAEQFMQHKGYTFPNLNDPSGQTLKRWGVSVTPTIFIIKDGQVKNITTGITTPPGLLARIWLSY